MPDTSVLAATVIEARLRTYLLPLEHSSPFESCGYLNYHEPRRPIFRIEDRNAVLNRTYLLYFTCCVQNCDSGGRHSQPAIYQWDIYAPGFQSGPGFSVDAN